MPLGHVHHRNSSNSLVETVFGMLNVGKTPVEVKVGATILAGRKEIYIVNDSSNVIFMSQDETFVVGVDAAMAIYSGTVFRIIVQVNPAIGNELQRFYVATDDLEGIVIQIVEVK